jgi:hypothetical protein
VETACSNTKIKENKFLVILTGFILKYVVTDSVSNNVRPDNYFEVCCDRQCN